MKKMPTHARRELAKKIGVGDDFLYQVLTGRKRASVQLCAALECETSREITCEELRPDLNWAVIRSLSSQEPAHG